MKTKGEYSTLVGSARAQANRARAKRAQPGREIARATNDYGTALGDVAGQAFAPLKARAAAAAAQATSRLRQAETLQTSAAVSNRTNSEGVAALQTSYAAQQARVIQSAAPGMISAKSAIAEANAYAERIGIDMKRMDWTAKAAVYQSIIDQNSEMARQQFALQSQKDMITFQMDLQKKAEADAVLQGAPMVVSAVTASMPGLVTKLQELAADDTAMDDPAATALEWAKTQTNDPNAVIVLQNIMLQAIQGVEANSTNDIPDSVWLQGIVQTSIAQSYPGFANTSEVNKSVAAGIVSATLSAWNQDTGFSFWHSPITATWRYFTGQEDPSAAANAVNSGVGYELGPFHFGGDQNYAGGIQPH